jgi:hypothetical protein
VQSKVACRPLPLIQAGSLATQNFYHFSPPSSTILTVCVLVIFAVYDHQNALMRFPQEL